MLGRKPIRDPSQFGSRVLSVLMRKRRPSGQWIQYMEQRYM
jgi:hypothetical protein